MTPWTVGLTTVISESIHKCVESWNGQSLNSPFTLLTSDENEMNGSLWFDKRSK